MKEIQGQSRKKHINLDITRYFLGPRKHIIFHIRSKIWISFHIFAQGQWSFVGRFNLRWFQCN